MTMMVTVSLVRTDGSLRHFNGYVTEFRLIKTDGGFAFYQMVLGPWLAFARLREDCASFHYNSVIDLTEAMFAHYLKRDYHIRLDDADPKLACANQYWRQAWIVAGQRFPDPQRDWKLDAPENDINWRLMTAITLLETQVDNMVRAFIETSA